MTTAGADLSLAEKAALTSGASFWTTKASAGHTAVVLTDGPHGVRAQSGAPDHLGISASEPATCFPPATGLAQTWDPELVERVGRALGEEARHYGVGVLLGPGVNIKRDPRGGRNFEYYSEDPYLTGELGTAWVRGVQSAGVGASVKHFAANNVEHDRMRSDSQVDPRALREIYLRAFQRIVTGAQPWTVMASYNRINGVYACENTWLLTDVLRGEWGFEGAVVSDWGAVRDRVAAVAAGLDLAMPGGVTSGDDRVAAAVRSGELDEFAVDAAARNVLRLLDRVTEGRALAVEADFDGHHRLAREAAARSVVLLKNDAETLPLDPSSRIAVIGRFAAEPRFQGGGSSRVRPTRLDTALEALTAALGADAVTYAPGFPSGQDEDTTALREEAVRAARGAEVAVLFLGLTGRQESEGFDRDDLELPADQLELLRAVASGQPRTVVVLSHGGVVLLGDVVAAAPAILDGGLLGQAGGAAVADVLLGVVNPSGKLAETVPLRLEDAPSYLNFPGEASRVRYGESIHLGYRGYDARRLEVEFPFGHGLSYTSFEYDDLRVTVSEHGITARVRIRNTGSRDGHEVVQFYVAKPESAVSRAPRELKAFGGADVPAGGMAEVEVLIRREDLAFWDERLDGWHVEGGTYEIAAAASSRDLRAHASVAVAGDEVTVPLTSASTLGEALAHPVAGPLLAPLLGGNATGSAGVALGVDLARMMASIPLDRLQGLSGGRLDADGLQALLDRANSSSAGEH